MTLSKDAKIVPVITPTAGAAATTDIEGAVIDTQGFSKVLFVAYMGTITTGAVTSGKVRESDNSDMSSPTDVENSGQTIADDADGKVFYWDLVRPTKRYVQLYIDRGTQNAVVAAALGFLYDARNVPTTHSTDVSGETLVHPAAGTA